MEIHKIPLYDEQGKPVALFGMVNEIGQRKELEQTFRQQQLLQRRLLDAIPDLIRLEDHQGVLIDCNQAFLDFMGLTASDALGRRVPPRLPVEQTLGQGEYCVVDAQGKGRHLEVTRVEVPDDEGYDFGKGAGFYLDATQEPWAQHYRMRSYIEDELPALIAGRFPADMARQGITGHSMGGHGAL